MRSSIVWGVRRRFHRLSPGHGHVAHALRTLAPVAANCITTTALPLDLHVLSLPLAFILSQDQTLLCIYTYITLSPIPTGFLKKKKSTLSNSRYNFSVLACTYFSLVNELSCKKPAPFSEAGAKVVSFLKPANFFCKKFSTGKIVNISLLHTCSNYK